MKIKQNRFLFRLKNKVKKAETLNIKYNNINIKQHSNVTYLGCILDETLSGESMALSVLNRINSRLRFLYRKKVFCRNHFVNYYVMLSFNPNLTLPVLPGIRI